jgi:hypothetical protein
VAATTQPVALVASAPSRASLGPVSETRDERCGDGADEQHHRHHPLRGLQRHVVLGGGRRYQWGSECGLYRDHQRCEDEGL